MVGTATSLFLLKKSMLILLLQLSPIPETAAKREKAHTEMSKEKGLEEWGGYPSFTFKQWLFSYFFIIFSLLRWQRETTTNTKMSVSIALQISFKLSLLPTIQFIAKAIFEFHIASIVARHCNIGALDVTCKSSSQSRQGKEFTNVPRPVQHPTITTSTISSTPIPSRHWVLSISLCLHIFCWLRRNWRCLAQETLKSKTYSTCWVSSSELALLGLPHFFSKQMWATTVFWMLLI